MILLFGSEEGGMLMLVGVVLIALLLEGSATDVEKLCGGGKEGSSSFSVFSVNVGGC